MTTYEFCDRYLPESWGERDLQLLIQRRLRRRLLKAPDEVRIKTPSTTRRADITTWLTVYEVKRYLTRENIFHAVAQTELYTHYGSKILWIFPKRRVVIGLAPPDYWDYQAAVSVARDFRAMGIKVTFINESKIQNNDLKIGLIICVITFLILAITGYFLSQFFL